MDNKRIKEKRIMFKDKKHPDDFFLRRPIYLKIISLIASGKNTVRKLNEAGIKSNTLRTNEIEFKCGKDIGKCKGILNFLCVRGILTEEQFIQREGKSYFINHDFFIQLIRSMINKMHAKNSDIVKKIKDDIKICNNKIRRIKLDIEEIDNQITSTKKNLIKFQNLLKTKEIKDNKTLGDLSEIKRIKRNISHYEYKLYNFNKFKFLYENRNSDEQALKIWNEKSDRISNTIQKLQRYKKSLEDHPYIKEERYTLTNNGKNEKKVNFFFDYEFFTSVDNETYVIYNILDNFFKKHAEYSIKQELGIYEAMESFLYGIGTLLFDLRFFDIDKGAANFSKEMAKDWDDETASAIYDGMCGTLENLYTIAKDYVVISGTINPNEELASIARIVFEGYIEDSLKLPVNEVNVGGGA